MTHVEHTHTPQFATDGHSVELLGTSVGRLRPRDGPAAVPRRPRLRAHAAVLT